jgi:flagellar basal-body rod protein FlgF
MNRGIYTVASGGLAAQARMEAVAQNLANASTAGYKAERPLFRVKPLTHAPDETPIDPVLDRTAAQVAEVATIRDFAQGPVHPSGNPLDVAIEGDGFLAVTTPRGERYTRAGNLTVDGDGYLVTARGDRVQGDSGDIRLPVGEAAIGADGSVRVDGTTVGRLKLVTFGQPPALVPEGAALFAPAPGAAPTPLDAAAVRLHPAALEGANTDAVAGMVELVDVARGYESYMKALQRLDQITEKSINEVGRVG